MSGNVRVTAVSAALEASGLSPCDFCRRAPNNFSALSDPRWLAIDFEVTAQSGLALAEALVMCHLCLERFYGHAFGPLDDAIEVAKKSLRKASQKEGTSES
jgi:hypothetical protein